MSDEQANGTVSMGDFTDPAGKHVPCFNIRTHHGQDLSFTALFAVETDVEAKKICKFVVDIFANHQKVIDLVPEIGIDH